MQPARLDPKPSARPTTLPPSTLALLALLACGPAQRAPETPVLGEPRSPSPKAARVEVDPPLEAGDAATRWRWIGRKRDPAAPCPLPPGASPWSARPLFAESGAGALPPGLRPFCVYEAAGQADPATLAALSGAGGPLLDLDSDAMAAAPTAGVLEGEVWRTLAQRFLDQAGWGSWPLSGGSPRLAIVDTGATRDRRSERYRGSSPHGYTLVNLARALLCPPPGRACLAEITTRLALAYEGFDATSAAASRRNEPEGGLIGLVGELAEAVRAEVVAWERAATGEPLVLNLSLAWHPRFGGGEAAVADMPVAAQAVYAALEDAACRGALVIAAAGNTGGGPEVESGPLLPAAWESRPAPAAADCEKALGRGVDPALFPPPGESAYRPLIYAVSGVRADGRPLASARPGAAARLAAFGDHAVASAPGDVPTAILTGSSVAALVVSAAATATWHYRGELRSDQVMEHVYRGGDDLRRSAAHCLGGTASRPCPDAGLRLRRATVCGAVASACARGGGDCPPRGSLPACPAWPAADVDLASAADLGAFIAAATEISLGDLDRRYPSVAACRGETLRHHPASLPADPCPHHQYHGLTAETWARPQPESDPCPACWLEYSSPGTLYLEIDPYFLGTLSDATLKLGAQTYALGLGPMNGGDTAIVTGIPELGEETAPVLLTFTLDAERSASSPILVLE